MTTSIDYHHVHEHTEDRNRNILPRELGVGLSTYSLQVIRTWNRTQPAQEQGYSVGQRGSGNSTSTFLTSPRYGTPTPTRCLGLAIR